MAAPDQWTSVLRLWIAGAGTALLAQGALSLLVDATGIVLPPLAKAFVGDPLHATIHVAWGAAMLAFLARRPRYETLARLSLVFGVFYVALAFLGVLVYHPFGLRLGPGENTFHFLVGPASLVVGAGALRRRATPAPGAAFTL